MYLIRGAGALSNNNREKNTLPTIDRRGGKRKKNPRREGGYQARLISLIRACSELVGSSDLHRCFEPTTLITRSLTHLTNKGRH